MSFSMAEVTAAAYEILGQSSGTNIRYPSSRLITHANNGLRRIAEVYPAPWVTMEWVNLAAEEVEQTADTRKLIGIAGFKFNGQESGSRALDVESLAAWDSAWRRAAPGIPSQAAVINNELGRFIVYPPPKAGVSARVQHVKLPGTYGANDTIPLPVTFIPPLAEYVAGMCEMADEEHVNSGRAAGLLTAFGAAVSAIAGGSNG